MEKEKNIPASLKYAVNIGALLMGAGNLTIVFAPGYFGIGVLVVVLGTIMLLPALRQIRRKKVLPPSENDLKRRFYVLAVAIAASLLVSPLLLPPHEGLSFITTLLINALLVPILVALVYWTMFRRLKEEIKAQDSKEQ